MAEVATTLTPDELKIEGDGLRDELIVFSGHLKRLGYDFTENVEPLLGDSAVEALGSFDLMRLQVRVKSLQKL